MKDIKTLYLTAKSSGNQKDIDSYLQCIRESIEKDPVNYVTNLEYIISSNIGLATFKEFVEKHGLSIGWYDTVMECMENCIRKCRINEKDATVYNETVAWLESFKKDYRHCFAVFESFKDDLSENYLRTYYGSNKAGIQNRRLVNGMMDKFGEAAIPDAAITADCLGENAVNTMLHAFNSNLYSSDPNFHQLLLESFKDIKSADCSLISDIRSKSLEAIVESMNAKYNQAFQESVIMGDENISAEYTEAEVKAVGDLIYFKENMITCLESVDEIMATQKEIYSLYERFESLISCNEDVLQEDIADSVIPMLPGARASSHVNPVEESKWLTNTGNKKTGGIPDYIKKNHNLDYGEDDSSNHGGRPGDDTEPTLDDYKRPSVASIPNDIETLLEPDTSKNTAFPDEPPKEHSDGKPLTNEEKQAINNYYYYTYTNSLNRNANSFNKHNSQRDDHSVNKRIRSDNINNSSDDGEDSIRESSYPWELNFETLNDVILESTTSDGILLAESIIGNIKNKIFQKKNSPKIPSAPEVYRRKYIPLTPEIQNIITENIAGLKSRISQRLNPIFQKYPIYGLSINVDDEDIREYDCTILVDDPSNPGSTTTVPGIAIVNDKMDTSISMEMDGYDQYDFSEYLEKNYPDEVKRLSEKHNVDSRSDWSQIHWMEKLCGYDKCLDDICNEIMAIINAEFKEVTGFEYDGDNDSGPIFSGKIDIKFLYPNFDPSQIKIATWTYNPKSVAAMSIPEKHFFRIHHYRTLTEAVGDADDMKPQSDHPVKDILTDIDRELVNKQQSAKKTIQNTVNAGKAFVKPAQRTTQWVGNMINQWKDTDETKVKEKLADPHARSGLLGAIKAAIKYGSLAKAGLLLNPIFLFLSLTRGVGKNKREFRLRNEMIGEIKTEIEIINEKIKDADRLGDNKAKYQLMRFKNELNKKLIRVGGNKKIAKLI